MTQSAARRLEAEDLRAPAIMPGFGTIVVVCKQQFAKV